MNSEKNIIVFLGKINQKHIGYVRETEEYLGQKFRIGVITHSKMEFDPQIKKQIDVLIKTNVKRIDAVEDALLPYRDQVVALISRYEHTMPLYARLIPFFPYLKHPTPKSIMIANDKIEMRKALRRFAPKVTPRYMVAKDSKKATLDAIEKTIKFPCIIKPASLSRSQLVINCYYREELERALTESLKKIKSLYKSNNVELEPKMLVEQLIEGDLYSVDVYVNSFGKMYFTPSVKLITGKDIGRDDFFMYAQITPVKFEQEEIEMIKKSVGQGIRAFGLRSCTAHVEYYKVKNNGVKIVEIGARVGGYRDEILGDAFGIQHSMNDILIHLGKKPVLKKKHKKYTAFLKYWPQKSGTLKAIKGYKTICELPFVLRSTQSKKPGDRVGLSKYGYPFICSFHLMAETRPELLGQIRKVEKLLKIILEK